MPSHSGLVIVDTIHIIHITGVFKDLNTPDISKNNNVKVIIMRNLKKRKSWDNGVRNTCNNNDDKK